MQDLIWLALHIALPIVVLTSGVAIAAIWINSGKPVLSVETTNRPTVTWVGNG